MLPRTTSLSSMSSPGLPDEPVEKTSMPEVSESMRSDRRGVVSVGSFKNQSRRERLGQQRRHVHLTLSKRLSQTTPDKSKAVD